MRTRNHESGRIKRELPHLTFLQSCDGYEEEEDDADEASVRGSQGGAAEGGQVSSERGGGKTETEA